MMGHQAIFTHNDLDGLVSALLARLAMPEAEVYFCEYNSLADLVRSRLDRYETIWLTDLSLRDDLFFGDLRRSGCEVLWFDHHASSDPQGWMRECRIDVTGQVCAAEVVRDYLLEQELEVPLPLQTLVDYAHDQDLWIRHLDAAQDFNDILGTMTVQQLFDELSADLGRVYHWSPAMTEACQTTQNARRRSIDLAKATAVDQPWADGQRLRACCCWGSVNEVAEEMGDEQTLVVLVDLRQIERGQLKCSFRTRSETIDANVVAERLGGGGHPKASGAPLPVDMLQALSAELLRRVAEAGGEAGA